MTYLIFPRAQRKKAVNLENSRQNIRVLLANAFIYKASTKITVKVKVKQSHYSPGVAQWVPGS
jgi:hypothetical protein